MIALGMTPVVAVDVNLGGLEQPRLESVIDVALQLAMLWAARMAREEAPEFWRELKREITANETQFPSYISTGRRGV